MFEEKELSGYRTPQGVVTIPPRFSLANPFSSQGIASVLTKGGYWAYIDTRGHELLRPFMFDNGPDYFQEGVARFVESFFNRA